MSAMRSVVSGVVVTWVLMSTGIAQRQLEFDVASVKERPEPGRPSYDLRRLQTGRLIVNSLPASNLLELAYDIVDRERIIGGPTWIDKLTFDVEATFDPVVLSLQSSSVRAGLPTLVPKPVAEMMQSLLAERFKLKSHFETRDAPIYALVVASKDGRLGPDLRRSAVDCSQQEQNVPSCGKLSNREGQVVATGVTIAELIGVLEWRQENDRPIRDFTGLDGRFDFTFALKPQTGSESVSIFSLVPARFGLKLEPRRAPERVLVIDRMERPSPN